MEFKITNYVGFLKNELFQKVEEEETLPKTFYDATITLIPKTDKITPKKKTIGKYL